jgi:hypothetical protein
MSALPSISLCQDRSILHHRTWIVFLLKIDCRLALLEMTEAQLHAYIMTEASEYLVWNDFVKCLDMNLELLKPSLGKVQWVWKLSTEVRVVITVTCTWTLETFICSGKNPLYLQRFRLCSPFVLNPEIQVFIVQAHIDSGALQMIPPKTRLKLQKATRPSPHHLKLYYAWDL